MKSHFLKILPVLLLGACVKDKPQVLNQGSVQLSSARKVYIVNEGNFMAGNASVSLYDPGSQESVDNIYHAQNGAALGDVAQSMARIGSSWYIVVNNSGKIVVCDGQMKYKATISGLGSPRYILPLSNSKAYVSELYGNAIRIVDLNARTVSGSIPCPGWTEQMLMIYGKVFVTNLKRNYLYVINASNNALTDSVFCGPNAGSLALDRDDRLWVLSSGDQQANIPATLKKIDPLSLQVLGTFTFAQGAAGHLCTSAGRDTLYYLNGDVYRMPVSATALPAQPFIAQANRNFYGLGISPHSGEVYVSDALDYIQRSNIYVYDPQGSQKHLFKAGINANSFYFE